ncbi:MAG: hypothetical protein V1870_02425 [Candidatus Aenigmatarchaeota archaeon]
MKITICASLEFTDKIIEAKNILEQAGHTVLLPKTTQKIIAGEITTDDITRQKQDGNIVDYARKNDAIREHYRKIQESDAILVL